MKSKVSLRKGRIKPAGTPLTEEKFQFYFESIKDLIRSESKSTQTVLRDEMDEKFNLTWVAISEHTRLIKGLDARMGGVETQLKGLDAKIDNVRTELKEDMRQMEGRLSEKIDGHSARLDNHEIRISAIEQG